MFRYRYNSQNTGNALIGVGAEGMGFDKPQTDPLYMPIPFVRSVWSQLMTTKPNVNHVQGVTPVGITGNGSIAGLQGTIALQALSDFEAQAKAGAA